MAALKALAGHAHQECSSARDSSDCTPAWPCSTPLRYRRNLSRTIHHATSRVGVDDVSGGHAEVQKVNSVTAGFWYRYCYHGKEDRVKIALFFIDIYDWNLACFAEKHISTLQEGADAASHWKNPSRKSARFNPLSLIRRDLPPFNFSRWKR